MPRSGPDLPPARDATAEELRRRAEHARWLARHNTDQITMDRLREFTQELEDMATAKEGEEGLPPTAP
jgi:hypothetical protein